MPTPDHAQAFKDAVKGIPAHHVARAMGQFTTGTSWTKCSKDSMAQTYRCAMDGKNSWDVKRFKTFPGLARLRELALQLQAKAAEQRKASEEQAKQFQAQCEAAQTARDAQRNDATMWRQLVRTMATGRITVTCDYSHIGDGAVRATPDILISYLQNHPA